METALMPLPDGYLPKEGDELLIRAKVKYDIDDGDENVHLSVVGEEWKTFIIPISRIHSLNFRAWNEGDKVCEIKDGRFGVVIDTHGDQVWVELVTGNLATFHANELEPQPKTQPATENEVL
jgi:hypothetical protein